MQKNILTHVSYVNLIRWWLAGILIFLPFQLMIANSKILLNSNMSSFIRYVDEITIIVLLPLAIIEFFRNREIRDWLYLILLFPLFLLCICGLISGIINNNLPHITILGSLDYIRNCFVIFIYAAFFREFSQFKKIFRILLIVAVFIGVIAFLQELWAIISNNFFINDNGSKIIVILKNLLPDYSGYHSRFGIYRMASLMENWIFLGLYCLLIFTIYLYTSRKVRFPVFFALFAGIFTSVSRMVYVGFIFISGLLFLRNKKKRILLGFAVIPILVLLLKLSMLGDLNVSKLTTMPQVSGPTSVFKENEENIVSYRKYSRDKAMQIWKDHPFWGVGPGMFGGKFSVEFESHIYEEYKFESRLYLNSWKHIDQFWPQVLAEMGIIGTADFAGLFVSLFVVLLIAQNRTASDEMKGLFAGCRAFLIVVLIYSTGSLINVTPVIFPFFALIGMGLGCNRQIAFEIL